MTSSRTGLMGKCLADRISPRGFSSLWSNISKVYLHQCILDSSGKAPGYWLNYYRTVYAKKCLANMDMSALQIAQSLNFAGLPQFCKFFKKNTGSTPSEFRKSLQWMK